MKMIRQTIVAAIGAVLSLVSVDCASAEDGVREIGKLGSLFTEYGVTGTFVLRNAATGELTVHNPERAAKRYIPASTFKIPNSLIGLETGAVKSVDEVVPYGGKPQHFPEWERDQSLREAIRVSAVPIYQEIARRVGLERMQEWLTKLDYGNRMPGKEVDQFWLSGPLEISALEQTEFLARLVKRELPAAEASVKAVEDITLIESSEGYELHAKTGWCVHTKPDLGWWVGWVKKDGVLTATFALNIDMPSKDDVPKRVQLGRACLAEFGVFPAAKK